MSSYKQKKYNWRRRRAMVVRLHDEKGMSFGDIARRLGITRGRAYQLYKKGHEDARAPRTGDRMPSAHRAGNNA